MAQNGAKVWLLLALLWSSVDNGACDVELIAHRMPPKLDDITLWHIAGIARFMHSSAGCIDVATYDSKLWSVSLGRLQALMGCMPRHDQVMCSKARAVAGLSMMGIGQGRMVPEAT